MRTRSVRQTTPASHSLHDAVLLALVLGSGSLIHQVGRTLSTAVERPLAEFDVTAQQAALLIHAAKWNAAPNQMAARLGTDTAGITRLVDRLETKGLLRRKRHPEDRRSVVIDLTDQGRALIPRLAPAFGGVTRQLLKGFTHAEVQQLSVMLRRMLDNLRE